jgi:hypothetical protein
MMSASSQRPFVHEVLNQIEALIVDAEEQTRPLEMDPYRGQLFDLFTAAWKNKLTHEEEGPLASDAICKELGDRWGLSAAAQGSVEGAPQLKQEHLAKMRSLWSVMRMWMEWNYAWTRWRDFNG